MAQKINIHDIRSVKSADITGKLEIGPDDLDLPRQDGISWHSFLFDYVLVNAGSLLVLTGKLEGRISQECSRCLKPVDTVLSIDVQEQFSRHPSEEGDETTHKYYGEEIEISGVLRDNIILNLPAKTLCSPHCLGLCPHCGVDRNISDCQCKSGSVDPRLAVLEKLIDK